MKNEYAPGQLAVVTGASSGIGYELAKVFAENGFDLIVAAEDAGIAEAGDAFRQSGVDVQAVRVDLSTAEGVDRLYEKIAAAGRPLSAIAMNAGVGVGGEFVRTDLERELKMIQLNVMSIVHLTKRILPKMVESGSGKILYTSSIAAEMPGPYYAVYAATKAFVQSFAEAIRAEVRDHGVTVTSLQPGATDTKFFERANMLNTKVGQGKKDDPRRVAEEGFAALMHDKDHVVAGSMMNAVQAVAAKFMSDPQGAKTQGASTKPINDY